VQEGRFQKLAETQLLKVRTRRRARSEPLDVLPISPFGTLLRCAIRLGSKTGTPVGLWQDALLGRVHSRVTVAECCISLAVAPFNLAARCLCGRAVYISAGDRAACYCLQAEAGNGTGTHLSRIPSPCSGARVSGEGADAG